MPVFKTAIEGNPSEPANPVSQAFVKLVKNVKNTNSPISDDCKVTQNDLP